MAFQFAKMAQIFAQHIMNIEKPKVGLLNVGEKREKELILKRFLLIWSN